MHSLRKLLYRQLSVKAREKLGLSTTNKVISLLIVASVVLAVLETEPVVRQGGGIYLTLLDLSFGILFLIEYGARVYAAGEEPRYSGVIGRLRYIVSPYALVDLIAVAPFLITLGSGDAFVLRLFRLGRILLLAKLGRYSAAMENIAMALKSRRYELYMSLVAAFSIMLISATVMFLTEGNTNPESFGSIPRALWWGVATVTKVGYAGAFPQTLVGKICAALFAVAAVGVVALPTGILAGSFSEAFEKARGKNDQDSP